MKYMGSKNRIAKHLIPIMVAEADSKGITNFYDICCGGCNLIDKVPSNFNRHANDKNEYLIEMWKALQHGFIPKDCYTKDEYNFIKSNKDNCKYLTGYVGFNCSYSGKWFGGYAGKVETKGGLRDYQIEAKNNVLKQVDNIKDVQFTCLDYQNIHILPKSIIYADIPYKNTTSYKDSFDHEVFYYWCIEQHIKGNIVFISEYEMPEQIEYNGKTYKFECIWRQEVKSSLSANGEHGGSKTSVEKLFKVVECE